MLVAKQIAQTVELLDPRHKLCGSCLEQGMDLVSVRLHGATPGMEIWAREGPVGLIHRILGAAIVGQQARFDGTPVVSFGHPAPSTSARSSQPFADRTKAELMLKIERGFAQTLRQVSPKAS